MIQSFIGASFATTARYAQNYDDTSPEDYFRVCNNYNGDQQNLRVTYSMGEGISLIRGVNFSYTSSGAGPHTIDLQFAGDLLAVNYTDVGIPHSSGDSWRVFYCDGPIYLLDDDPAINFIGSQPSHESIRLGGDTKDGAGNSYYDTGSGWTLQSNYEYLVQLIYEWIVPLNISASITGEITVSDNIDAYFVNLTVGLPYVFILDRTTGSGNLSLRLVSNQELTNDDLAISYGTPDRKYLSYTPESDGIYVLLVEANSLGVDIANYELRYVKDNPPTSNNPETIITTSKGTETIDWILIDDAGGGKYQVLINSTPSGWYSWVNASNLQFPINRTAPGRYNYTINYNDTGGNWGIPNTVNITILDSKPTSNHPEDITVPVNGSATIPWVLMDDYGAGYYRVIINGIPGVYQPWENNSFINYPINSTETGIFNYVISYNDSAGNTGDIDLVVVTVVLDTVPPVSNQPNNITTTRGGTETINWTLIDDVKEGYYRVLANNSVFLDWTLWGNNSNLQVSINRTRAGFYNYTIQYNDSAGYWGTPSSVFVTIVDNPPIINQPDPIIVSTTGSATIPWIIIDDYGAGFYRVLIDSTPGPWQEWNNNTNLHYPVNTSVLGTFNYTIQYNDSSGLWGVPSSVTVTVLLDAPPTSNNPEAIITYVNYTETISWILWDDLGEGYYRVLINGTAGEWAPWINNSNINYPINTTAPGDFNYTIQFNDSAGQMGVPHTVMVSIGIDLPPFSNHPELITTYVGYTAGIGWVLTDDVGAGYYRVLLNGTPSNWAPWTNNTDLNYPINTNAPGITNYTIQFNDSAGNWGIPDEVIVTVKVDSPPTVNQPSDIYTIVNSIVYINWILSDDVGEGLYRILVNNSPSDWHPWVNGYPLNIQVNTSTVGTFNYTIEYNDSRGQIGTPDTVLVFISEPPLFPTGETQVNFTCSTNGTITTTDETGFSVPVDGWNSTLLQMEVSEISLYDYYYPIEENYGTDRYQIDTEQWVMGVQLLDSCIIDAIDFHYSTYYLDGIWPFIHSGADTQYTSVFIYNATYKNGQIEPHALIYYQNESGLQRSASYYSSSWVSGNPTGYWNGTLTDKPLVNMSETYNNYIFVSFKSNSALYWHYIDDAADPEGDQGLVYYQGYGGAWNLRPTDATLRLQLSPVQSQASPSEVEMMINSEPVMTSGLWNTSELLVPGFSGSIPFNVSLLWYNVSYSLNWTSHLEKLGSAEILFDANHLIPVIQWNITVPAVFIDGAYNKRINVTIPATWNATNVYINSGLHSTDFWDEISSNLKKAVIIQGADNGTWVVTADGQNWISDITFSKTPIYILDEVNISALLIHQVFDMELDTAQIYIIDSYQQTVDTLFSYGGGNYVNLTWRVFQSIHTHGDYQILMVWFNGTEAGVWNTSVCIYNSTTIQIVSPEHKGNIIEAAIGEPFNLTVYYNMSFWDGDAWGTVYLNELLGATLTCSLQGEPPQSMVNTTIYGNWAWTVSLTAPEAYGSYPIYINATAGGHIQNYTNYLITLSVKQFGTTLLFNETSKIEYWNNSVAFRFSYTNITGHSILTENITIEWKYEGDSTYRGFLTEAVNYSILYNNETEEYTVTFTDFAARHYNLLFHIDSDLYESQNAYLTLIFNNRTTSLNNLTYISRLLYQDSGIVNLTVYFEDTVGNIGISGAMIQSNWSNVKSYMVYNLGDGYYNISLDLSGVLLQNYSISITAWKMNYETAFMILPLEIYAFPTQVISLTGRNLTGTYADIYAKENWTLSFQYINMSNGVGISGATIYALLEGEVCIWQDLGGGNYSIWADTTKLSAPMAGHSYTLQVQIGELYYEAQVILITLDIQKLPTQIFPQYTTISAEIDQFVEVRVQLNDTYNQEGVSGILMLQLPGIFQQMTPSPRLGEYFTILNLTGYTPGLYLMNLSSWAVDYQNASFTIILNVSRLGIFIITENETVQGYVNEVITLQIQLKDSQDRLVENHPISYLLTIGIGIEIEASFVYKGNGYYDASINLSGLAIQTYQLRINASLTERYSERIIDLDLEVMKIPTLLVPSATNITGYLGNLYVLSVNFLDALHGTVIGNEDLQFEIPGQVPLTSMVWIGGGTYQGTLNLTSIGAGSYEIEIQTGVIATIYQAANATIELHIVPKIPTELIITHASQIAPNEILNITYTLQTGSGTSLPNEIMEYIIYIEFYNGTKKQIQGTTLTNGSGQVSVQYRIPFGAYYINVIGSFIGTSSLDNVWNSSLIFVESVRYNLAIRVPPSVNVGTSLNIYADLSNETHPLVNVLINFTIILVFSSQAVEEIYLSGYTNINGTASVTFNVPHNTISIYVIASYQSLEGKVINSSPQTVLSIDPFQDFMAKFGIYFALILIGVIAALFIVYGGRKARARFMSIESKKRALIQKRGENRRQIAIITEEIKQMRSKALQEAEEAVRTADFVKAAESYEKAGNLTLELADKSVAREFFLKSKDMQRLADQKSKQKDLREQREKTLERAREAIRNRDIAEASKNYRQVAEISRILGEREQADKFLKLADAAYERVEALKEGDLRKKSGTFLSKADKAMGKQNFIEAARNFEEAAKIMLHLNDEEAVQRFTGWAKLAREREGLAKERRKDEWENELIEAQKELVLKAQGLVRERDFDGAAEIYSQLTIYALELGNLASVKKFRRDLESCKKQTMVRETSSETVALLDERKELLANADEAVKNERYAAAAKYYRRIASISEGIEGKEVARTYLRQANYYLEKVHEKQIAKELKADDVRIPEKVESPIARVTEDQLEETKSSLALTLKNAREALKTGKPILAKELYEKAAVLAAMIGDKPSESRYRHKAEEIEVLQSKKSVLDEGEIRRNITDLMQKAEKALKKKKYNEAKNYYEEISEFFIQLRDEDAANEFLERANSLRRLI